MLSSALFWTAVPRARAEEYERVFVPFFFHLPMTKFGGGFKYADLSFFGKDTYFDLTAVGTQNKDYVGEMSFEQRKIAKVFFARVRALYSDQRSRWFYGFGNDTRYDALTAYSEKTLFARFGGGISPVDIFRIGLDMRYETFDMKSGRIENVASVESRFSDFPGFDQKSSSVTMRAYVLLDAFDHPLSPMKGGLVEIYYETNRGFSGSTYPYHNWTAKWVQLYPVVEQKLIFATQIHYTGFHGDGLPVYHRARLGGYNTIRSYPLQRFTHDKSLLFNAEIRWNLFNVGREHFFNRLELAPFIDVGRVYERREDLSLDGFHAALGAGVRLAVGPGLVIRFDAGFANKHEWATHLTFMYPF